MNKKVRRIFILLVFFIMVGILGFVVFNTLGNKKVSSLEVNSNVKEAVFLDGEDVGSTPFTGVFNSKEVVVRVGNYEARVTLQPGIKTIINRNFDNSTSLSWGETLSFEKTGISPGILAVVTGVSGASVSVDQKPYGLTPLDISSLMGGKHQVLISMDGYSDSNFVLNLVDGYKLTAFVDLKPGEIDEKKAEEIAPIKADVFVKILSTPNGFLRVRSGPNITSSEIARVHEGEKYKLLGSDSKTGWFDIELNASQSGWITNVYAATSSAVVKGD